MHKKNHVGNGLLCQPLGLLPNYLQTKELYFLRTALDFPSLKGPSGIDTELKEALATLNQEVPGAQKVLKLLYDDVTIIPIHATGRTSVQQKNVHDSDYIAHGGWPDCYLIKRG